MNTLEQICEAKKDHIERMKAVHSLADLETETQKSKPPKGFIDAVHKTSLTQNCALITEIKKASPSRGVIREDFDPVAIAKSYESAGATCLSVLTDEPYFQGKDQYLSDISAAVNLPILRKDFILDPYQITESRALGADCILLIMAALSDSQARELYDASESLGMDVLVEVHNEKELERALNLNPKMIGVNNRNLKTLEIDIQTSQDLAAKIPDDVLKISESGIGNPETIKTLQSVGYKGFLVGTKLMQQGDIAAATRALLG